MAPIRPRAAIAVATAFAVVLAAGTFWLFRLVAVGGGNGTRWQSVATGVSAGTPPPPTGGTGEPTGAPNVDPGGPATDGRTGAAPTRTPPTGPDARATAGPRGPGAAPTTTTKSPESPPVPPQHILVGGVTLDSSNPDFSCTSFRNVDDFDVPVRVLSVNVSSSAAAEEAGHCKEHKEADRACAHGVLLRPGGDGCYTGIVLAGDPPPERARARISLALAARCTSRTGEPCKRVPVRYRPAPGAPVEVRWRDGGRDLCTDQGTEIAECEDNKSETPS